MKKFIFAMALLATVSATRAQACSETALRLSEQTQAQILEHYKVGIATQTDVLVAEKDLLDKQLCLDLHDQSIFNDVTVLKKLSKNVNARIGIEKLLLDIGLGETAYLELLNGEKASYSRMCENILQTSKTRYEVGLISKAQLNDVDSTCKLLKE